jgi:DNA-binding response OmpR family regulator
MRPGSADSAAGGITVTSHVLLVEDELNIAEAIIFLLSRDGWRVSHVAEGDAALAQIRSDRPDLVILDHMLPGLSGIEIVEAIRADADLCALPVLMLSARGRDRDLAERAGVNRFVAKPFANAEILAEVRALMGR